MQNRTLGIVATAITAFICGCMGLMSCIFGALIARGTPFEVTSNGVTAPQTFPPAIGFALLCASFLFILIPIAVGFFTLRKKPEAMQPQDLPPVS